MGSDFGRKKGIGESDEEIGEIVFPDGKKGSFASKKGCEKGEPKNLYIVIPVSGCRIIK